MKHGRIKTGTVKEYRIRPGPFNGRGGSQVVGTILPWPGVPGSYIGIHKPEKAARVA
jgi:hypothetical protein